jgi:hypothetical protein
VRYPQPSPQTSLQTGSAPEAETVPGELPWSETRVVKTLWPPQPGTRQLRKRYGSALVCVRYRQDPEGRHRYTTVEVMVDHAPVRYHPNGVARHLLPVPFWDAGLREQLLAHGAKWNYTENAWQLTKAAATKLGVLSKTRRIKRQNVHP